MLYVLALKFALSYLNIYSGITFLLSGENYVLQANLQPNILSPTSGSVTASNFKEGNCFGKYTIDLEQELMTINFEDASAQYLVSRCNRASIMISLNLTEDEYGDLLQGRSKEAKYKFLYESDKEKSATLQIITE